MVDIKIGSKVGASEYCILLKHKDKVFILQDQIDFFAMDDTEKFF